MAHSGGHRLQFLAVTEGGAAHSLAYQLTIRDAANRVIACETSVYSPGAGRVRHETNGTWQMPPQCGACPCPG